MAHPSSRYSSERLLLLPRRSGCTCERGITTPIWLAFTTLVEASGYSPGSAVLRAALLCWLSSAESVDHMVSLRFVANFDPRCPGCYRCRFSLRRAQKHSALRRATCYPRMTSRTSASALWPIRAVAGRFTLTQSGYRARRRSGGSQGCTGALHRGSSPLICLGRLIRHPSPCSFVCFPTRPGRGGLCGRRRVLHRRPQAVLQRGDVPGPAGLIRPQGP